MAIYVDPNFKIDIFLDTNILEDYLENQTPRLTECVDFLATCPYVTLHASHYVEYELTEIRKIRLFELFTLAHYSKGNDVKRRSIKKNWKLNGHNYSDFQQQIEQQVTDDIRMLKFIKNINFDDNVLHDDLIEPVKRLTLRSSLSREDSMVTASCVFPSPQIYMTFSALLSSDAQFSKAFIDNSTIIENSIREINSSIKVPLFLYSRSMHVNSSSQDINLYNTKNGIHSPSVDLMKNIVLELIIQKQHSVYFGNTYRYNNRKENLKNVLFFKLRKEINELEQSSAITVVSKDLEYFRIIPIQAGTYKNNGKPIELPFSEPSDRRFSVETKKLTTEDFRYINETGHLLFYNND